MLDTVVKVHIHYISFKVQKHYISTNVCKLEIEDTYI